MEKIHIAGRIVYYDEKDRLVLKHLRRMEESGDPQLEDWFTQAKNKGKPKITDVDGRGKERFSLMYDDGAYTITNYKASWSWF